jgi:hypothetical protein
MNQLEFDFLEDQDDNEEELTTVILNGIPIKEYSISKSGNVYSHIRQERSDGKNGFNVLFSKSYKRLLKSRTNKGYVSIDITFDSGTFDYEYRSKSVGSNRQAISCRIHKLVIDSWKPFDQNLPTEINEVDYNNTPESIRTFLRELFIVNHIDHNKSNNHLDNLERVTHKQNSRAAIDHYSKIE